MSTLNPPRDTSLDWSESTTIPRSGWWRGRIAGYLAVLAMVVPAGLLLAAGLIAGLPPAEGDVESGVRIGQYEVSDVSWQEASVNLELAMNQYLDQPVTLIIGDKQVEATPRELGFGFDLEATHERALGIGRGNVFEAARERFDAHTRGIEVKPVVVADEDTYLTALGEYAEDVVEPPSNAHFYVEGGQVAIEPSSEGVGIDTAEGLNRMRHAVADFRQGAIEIPTTVVSPDVTTDDLEAMLDDATALSGSPLVLIDDDRAWQLTPADLVPLLRVNDGNLALDAEGLEARIAALEPVIEQPAKNADLIRYEDGTFAIVDEQVERALNIDASLEAALDALESGENQVALVVDEDNPPVIAAKLRPLYDDLTRIAERGVTLSWPGGSAEIDKVAFAESLVWNIESGDFWFDHERLAQAIQPIAGEATQPPQNLRWLGGQVVAGEGASPGMTADVEETIPNVINAAMSGSGEAQMAMKEAESFDPAQLGIEIKHVLGSATSYYGDSSANRKTNIEVAARALNGAMIPPHSTFSFNEAIGGTTTLEDGYMMGYGIISEGGEVQTVPSIAGGICQVSTMVFQAAFWSGMPITHRTWHLYWIPRYGNGQGGLKGLDATVDPDYGLDFNFYNPTDDWLAITAWADGQNVTVEVWGVDQGWAVEVDDPEITNVIPADMDTIYRENDPSIPAGQEVWVETAGDGFTANIHRVVKDAEGNVIEDTVFTSNYQPARNLILVGTGE